ncbi:FimV/HubP family polar landmark protein [Vibrio sp. PID23_8]|uniref:FimV/HubP family polar landmark protein n=1 Tax=Vibrio sp. PID23_8 TaxID=1583767 RepID=UPI000E6A4B66|nr:FimV/HubP family polar landmark protein [Vibrio sp. PID23_8]RIZ56880.1 AAA family ATPase [Vibrio sp. PID23_8]
MRQNYKCLLAALVLMSTTQTSSVVQAEGIRLVGPSGEVQASPSYAGEIERALSANTQPSRFFGPTGQNETLWSIASQLRPSRNVSVQQTLLAIYRINPQAFDNQNIHELIPGSRLRIPSLEQVQSATTAQAVAIMKAHEARSNQPKPPKPAPAKSIVEQPKPVAETTKPKVTSETVKPEMAKPKPVKSVELTPLVPTLTTSPEGEKQVSALKDKLQISQGELESLEEKNHRLRLMLSDVQNEVETLKTELNDEARIRTEVEKLLAEERKRLDEQQRMQPSTMDKILSNGWLVGLAALIPGALIALLVVTLLGRRAKSEEEQAAAQEPQSIDPLAAPLGLAAAEELEEELSLDDDLFGDDESANLFDQEEKPEEDDVFGNLDDDDLDFNLEGDDEEDPFASIGDDGDLDVGFYEFDSSNNGIKVNGEEKALGLEEMERALDEASPELEIVDDEQVDFDLSDEESANDPFADLLAGDEPTEDLQSDSIDQALLDDLFADFGSDDLNLDVEDDKSSSAVSELGFSVGEATEDEIDKLLAQYDQPTTNSVEDLSKESDEATPDELDPFDELENIAGLSDDPSIEEDSTELLDELIGLDDEDASDDFDPLNELEKLSGFDGIEDLDEDSVDLLDELLDDNNTDEELDEDSKELDPFDDLIREDDEPTNSDSLSDDDLLASLGFGRLEPEVTEGIQSQPQSVVESSEKLDDEQVLGLESGLDIDALLSDNQPEREVESELQTEPLRQETDLEPAREEPVNTFEGNDTSDDLDSILNDEPQVSNEQDVPFEAETALDTQHELAEERTHSESGEDASELLNNYANALAQQSESEVDEAPVFTPTPDTVENEFGIPQEEDWLVDDIESETKLEQEPIAARSTETDIEDEESNFDALELPEFNEDDALASMADEPALPESEKVAPEAAVTETAEEEAFNFDDFDLPEFNEDDALASMADEPAQYESEKVAPEAVVTEAVEEEAFNLDDFDLPEFNEDDALASMADEPTLPESETAELSSSAEMAEDNAMSFDDLDLPEFDEEDALMSMTDNAEAHQPVLQSDNDHDALFEVFAQPGAFVADFESEKNEVETELNDFEEAAMANLLAENVDSQVFDGNLDSDTVASAGMDFETMLGVGDDWNGFKLSTECTSTTSEVPEDQREVWGSAAALAQPEIAPENWAEQDDLADFDPKKHQFMTIDELMAQVDKDGGEFEEQELKLDVGLNEFPDVIGDIGDVDVDSNAEAAGKLDLAKIYLEMNDPQGAVKLLEEAIVYGEDDIRREAKHLIDDIHGR